VMKKEYNHMLFLRATTTRRRRRRSVPVLSHRVCVDIATDLDDAWCFFLTRAASTKP
jgi:hypothetical protein